MVDQYTVAKYVLGIILILSGLFLVPQMTGVRPFSTVGTGGDYTVLAFSYDPSNNTVMGEVQLLGTGTTPSQRLCFKLADQVRERYKVDVGKFCLDASVVSQDVYYAYSLRDFIGEPVCIGPYEGSAETQGIGDVDVWRRAMLDAKSAAENAVGTSLDRYFSGRYTAIITDYWEDRAWLVLVPRVHVKVKFCGVHGEAYAYYDRTGDSQVDARVRVQFFDEAGNPITTPIVLESKLGATQRVQLANSRAVIGSFEFTTVVSGTDLEYLLHPPAQALISLYDPEKQSQQFFKADYSLARYLDVVNNFRQLMSKGSAYFVNPGGPTYGRCEKAAIGCDTLLQKAYEAFGENQVLFARDELPVKNPVDPTAFDNYAGQFRSMIESDLRDPVPSDHIYVEAGSEIPRRTVLYREPLEGVSAYGYRVKYVLSASVLGVEYIRPEPEIVRSEVGTCTTSGCELSVTLRNRSKYGGRVTITVSDTQGYFEPTQKVVSVGPSSTVTTRIYLTPRYNLTLQGPVDDVFSIEVEASHPLEPVVVSGTVSGTVKPERSCMLTVPVCGFDPKTGLYFYQYCKSPYDPRPTVVKCGEGEVCVGGSCVPDSVVSVSCVDDTTYKVKYAYSGEKVQTCEQGYICSADLASQGKVPPCVKSSTPPPPPVPPVKQYPVKINLEGPDYRALSWALILLGLGVLLL